MNVAEKNVRCFAVLGWQDRPTDAVQEYCEFLGSQLPSHGFSFELIRVRWPDLGWPSALRELDDFSKSMRGAWFLIQYTALTWSRRGFPLNIFKVIRTLKTNGGNCALVFHDSEPYPGNRFVDKIRRRVQIYTMKKAIKLADVAIFNVPPNQNIFLPQSIPNAVYIPVGANLPSPESVWFKRKLPGQLPTVGIFSLSEGTVGEKELQLAADAMRYTSERLGPLRLTILGRNSDACGLRLRELLAGTQVKVDILGLLKSEEVVQVLGACDAMLFVRGPISTRRGSAVAGIACGLPVIGRVGWETGPPLTEAGVALIPETDQGQYGPTLLKILSDPAYRAELAERSRNAQERHFSWKAIAAQYAEALSAHSKHTPSSDPAPE